MDHAVLICCFGIGVTAGLRSMTAPVVVSLAAYFGWLSVGDKPFWFVAFVPVVILLTAWAIFELVIDKTTITGDRTAPLGLIFRIVTSTLSGAVIANSTGASTALGAILGLCGGMAGTFGGYHLRRAAVRRFRSGDLPIALAEDILAIALGILCVFFLHGPA